MSLLTGVAEYLAANIQTLAWNPGGGYASDERGVYLLTLPATGSGVALVPYGGPGSSARLGHDSPSIQARVRGSVDPRDGLGLAQGVYDTLHGLTEHELGEGTYVTTAVGLQSGPVYIGKDDNSRHEFTVNFRFQIRNPTVHREIPV